MSRSNSFSSLRLSIGLFLCAFLVAGVSSFRVPNSQIIVEACSLASNNSQKGFIPHFQYQNGTGISNTHTTVFVCHNNFQTLNITWTAQDNSIHADLTQCNDPLYQQDAVEVFLGNPETYLTNYLEVEVNPRAALFVSNINNKSDSCQNFSGDLIQCVDSGIKQSAKLTSTGYIANVLIPLSLVTKVESPRLIKGNFFRINMNNNLVRDYSCWIPTLYTPACFHRPSVFGDIVLV